MRTTCWTSRGAVLAILASALWLPAAARAGEADGAPCLLLTPAEVEAALGAKVSDFAQGQGGDLCYATSSTLGVMLRLAKRSGPPGREAKGIEAMKQMGGQVDVKTFGPMTCSTFAPPASLVQAMGFITVCSTVKGEMVAAVEVTARAQKDAVSIERLRPLAEKMASRF